MRLRNTVLESELSLQAEYLLNAAYFGDYFKDTLKSVVPDKVQALTVKPDALAHMINYMDVPKDEAEEMIDNLIDSVYTSKVINNLRKDG